MAKFLPSVTHHVEYQLSNLGQQVAVKIKDLSFSIEENIHAIMEVGNTAQTDK